MLKRALARMPRGLRVGLEIVRSRFRPQAFYRFHEVEDFDVVLARVLNEQTSPETMHRLLDVGGGTGETCRIVLKPVPNFKYEYWCLELPTRGALEEAYTPGRTDIVMDVCQPMVGSPPQMFDVVFSYDAFEHFPEPFVAAENIAKLTKPGGLVFINTVFSWHHHMSPKDYFRYTDTALEYMFGKYGFDRIACGYDITKRRSNKVSAVRPDSEPLVDWRGGWLERWSVYYVGRRRGDQ